MAGPWEKYLQTHKDVLAKPSAEWLEHESSAVWEGLGDGPLYRYLYGFVFSRVHHREDSQDVLQECLMQLSLGKTYDPTGRGPKAFKTWILACLGKRVGAFMAMRREEIRRMASEPAASENADPVPNNGREHAKVDAKIATDAMLRTLAPRAQDVLARTLRDQTDEEIARALGLTESHVRQIRFRANSDLRKMFEKSIKGPMGK